MENRARATIPWPLAIGPSKIPEAGSGVITNAKLPCCLVFGPYQGTMNDRTVNAEESGYGWQIRTLGDKPLCVDAADVTISNWMRYVNCPRHEKEVNLSAFQYKGQIYYKSTKSIDL